MLKRGLPREIYDAYMQEAIDKGLIPIAGKSKVGDKLIEKEDILTQDDILEDIASKSLLQLQEPQRLAQQQVLQAQPQQERLQVLQLPEQPQGLAQLLQEQLQQEPPRSDVEIDKAVRAFESKVAPLNYKRTKAWFLCRSWRC